MPSLPKLAQWLYQPWILLVPCIFLSAGNMSSYNYHPLDSQLNEYQQLKSNLTEEIYNKICATIKDRRKPPAFRFIYNYNGEPYYNAFYSPSKNTINFGEGIYDLAKQFGKDSINVIATVLAHEITHFYKDHGWAHAFGKANPDTKIAENVQESMYDSDDRARMEAEADYFGGIFGYMSGYNTLEVSAEFFNRLYEALEIPDETFGYPSRSERIGIYNNAKRQLEALIPVFNVANVLNVSRRYEAASRCYEHIMSTFPSREIYNNAGVALAQEAVGLFSPEELKFVYPFGLDLDTRLNQAGTKGVGESKEAKRKRLLIQALADFKEAVQIDDQYAAAYSNLALTHALLDEPELALGFAKKAVKLATNEEISSGNLLLGNAYLAQGIAAFKSKDKALARQSFKAAEAHNQLLASANLEALNDNVFARLFKKKASAEIEGEEESIAEVGVEALEVLLEEEGNNTLLLKKQNEERPEMHLTVVNTEEFDAIILQTFSGPWNVNEEVEGFLITKADYDGETTRGIQIGSSYKEVMAAYGTPARTITSTAGNYLFYEKTGLVFVLDPQSKVSGWLIYGKVR